MYFNCKMEPLIILSHSIPVPTQNLIMHDRTAEYIQEIICKNRDLLHDKNWWEEKPPPEIENDPIPLLWNIAIQTYRKPDANRPVIILKDFRLKFCYVIDITLPNDMNVSVNTYQQQSNIKIWREELIKCGKLKTRTISVVLDARAMITKMTYSYLAQILRRL